MQTSELDPQQEKQKRIQQLEYHYREYGKVTPTILPTNANTVFIDLLVYF